MADLRLPVLSQGTAQSEQIRSYLYQLVEQLNIALNESNAAIEQNKATIATAQKTLDVEAAKTAVSRFNEIKGLIIKSADIVEAYSEEMKNILDLSGRYVAVSDFGTYQSETNNKLSANESAVTQALAQIETVNEWKKGQVAYLKYGQVGTTLDDTGMASTTAPGIEIGDYQVLSDGTASYTNRRFARFTAYGLELFGESKDSDPVAYITANKMYITQAEITQTLKLGGYEIDKSNGLSFDWVG